MTGIPRGPLAAGAALVFGLALLSGCTGGSVPPPHDPAVPPSRLEFHLVTFDSCADVLDRLRSAAKTYVGPWGLSADQLDFAAVPKAASDATAREAGEPSGASALSGVSGPGYSGTNTHEIGVDEPDIVKTDGRRIVTIGRRGVLRVIDPASRRVVGTLDLTAPDSTRWSETDLLLHGDRALVLVRNGHHIWPNFRAGDTAPEAPVGPADIAGPRLMLVDLAGPPRLLGEYRVDGRLVDARQMNGVARVVVRSAPRLVFPNDRRATDAQRTATNQAIIDRADVDDWLPRYRVTEAGRTRTGRVGCDRINVPPTFSGTSMLTVLSFPLAGGSLGDGDPITIVADGDTVYGNGPHLYVTNDRWRPVTAGPGRGERAAYPGDPVTEIYQFDTSGPGRPRYLTAGSVPGRLINQYALSEWDGHLRVATTSGRSWEADRSSSSTVYVLRATGDRLIETGRVGGLGKGEQIYSVRFTGPTGYVVTFRQTDPLYTLDLTDPTSPRVTGELKITGYSAYLHPVDGGRLLGIGQEASTRGRTRGTQISLFDVSDLAEPTRLARYHVRRGHSAAEFDPHAFLYWAPQRLLVVPITAATPHADGSWSTTTGALVLRVADSGFTEIGMVKHPGRAGKAGDSAAAPLIHRSLVVDGVLWTVSDAGLLASDLSTMDTLAWLPGR